jgi:hypothetical protein
MTDSRWLVRVLANGLLKPGVIAGRIPGGRDSYSVATAPRPHRILQKNAADSLMWKRIPEFDRG